MSDIKIPDNHKDFIKSVLRLMEEYGIERADIKYMAKLNGAIVDEIDRSVEAFIRNTDGRGRPQNKIMMRMTARKVINL